MRRVHLLVLGLLLPLIIEATPECRPGFVTNRGYCVDENECDWDNPPCGEYANCINTPGSYKCQCHTGYQKTGNQCKDINECHQQPDLCGPNSDCVNSLGSFSCTCKSGFIPSNNTQMFLPNQGVTCDDINECHQQPDLCGPNSDCVNSLGSYACICEKGFIPSNNKETFLSNQGVTCGDMNECESDQHICGDHATCNNTFGDYNCTCDQGYSLRPGETHFSGQKSCEHICTVDTTLCGEGSCNKTEDGYECVCKEGFTNYGLKTMRCSKLDCGFLTESSAVQISAELEKILQNLGSSCENLSKGEPVMSRREFKVDVNKLLEEFLDAIDKLLSSGLLNDNKKVTALLEMTENVLKLLGPLLPNTTKSKANIEIEMLVRRGKTPPRGPLVLSTSDAQFKSLWETAAGESYLGFAAASLLSYKSLENSVKHFNWIEKEDDETLNIISKVVTAGVTNPNTTKLKTPVNLTFFHQQQSSNRTPTCVFWDSSLGGGAWSTQGCTVVTFNTSYTVCSCTHLSSFAVLMALHEIEDSFELQLITWVGLSLSLICLLICIVTFRFVRSIQSTRNTIHLHLCISLFIANLVFLAGITQTDNKVGCSVVAGLLHFFFLAAFCWMCLEGVQLFRMVVLVFNTTIKSLYLMAAGYGVPALIVGISAIINAKGYGTDRHCWLNLEHGFIWSFFGPVCFIIVVNVFFFLITVWKLAEKFSSLNQDVSNLNKIKTFTVTAIAQLCVLGTMWIFGCFQFEGKTMGMTYLFTILNSLQGALVFLMHCLLSKQVREEYTKILTRMCAPQKRQYSEFSTNQSSKSQGSRSVQNTGESHI